MANTTTVAPVATKHIFEMAGLGTAPYTFLRVEVAPMAACQFCGTAICYKFWLRSREGFEFYVGSDCIFKSSDAGLHAVIDPIVRKHEQEIREARDKGYIGQFEAYLALHPDFFKLDTRPHPFNWRASRGETYGMYNEQIWKWAGRSKKANLARQFLIGAGIIDPKSRKGRAHAKGCTCDVPTGEFDICTTCSGLKKPTIVIAEAKRRFKTWAMNAAPAVAVAVREVVRETIDVAKQVVAAVKGHLPAGPYNPTANTVPCECGGTFKLSATRTPVHIDPPLKLEGLADGSTGRAERNL
jgi:hypothetical protein